MRGFVALFAYMVEKPVTAVRRLAKLTASQKVRYDDLIRRMIAAKVAGDMKSYNAFRVMAERTGR